ncbi:Transposase, IS116/IS110/IS902 family [Leptospira santarosai]|uniref:Transposase, IS116/IS110/IS902 family n=1 Tax=Leptospira santarosai TaxID=28183 RepID=A0A2P1QNG3_9LEPT|nr:Transposase, IS116/IS110/IS902 family [Leptospira santarosai]
MSTKKRFKTAGSFMSFLELVPGEYSSASKRKQTGITKTGSPRLRRILTEAAWQHRFSGTGSKVVVASRVVQSAKKDLLLQLGPPYQRIEVFTTKIFRLCSVGASTNSNFEKNIITL